MIKCSREEDENLFAAKFVGLLYAHWGWELEQRGKEEGQESKLQKHCCTIFPSAKILVHYVAHEIIKCKFLLEYSVIYRRVVPGFLLGWKLAPPLCGKKTPVPHDFWPDSRKIACIPDPLDAQLQGNFGLWCGRGLVLDCWLNNYRENISKP